jgi:hypothetical protein
VSPDRVAVVGLENAAEVSLAEHDDMIAIHRTVMVRLST